MEDKAVKSLVNKIFAMKGMPKVTNFAAEFSDGGKLLEIITNNDSPILPFPLALFQAMFNILYEENINCRLSTSTLLDDKMLNWNRLNAQICFNYLQQEFYLVKPTMRTLATGKNQTAILKLLRILINTCQSNFGDLNLDDECIRDIADVITADTPDGIVGSAATTESRAADVQLKEGYNANEGHFVTATMQPRGAILADDKAYSQAAAQH